MTAHAPHVTPPAARLTAVFAGPVRALHSPRETGRESTAWRSAILKAPQAGPVAVETLGLVGDAQYDRRHHGGPTKAVLCYAAAHYAAWAPLAAEHLAVHGETIASLPGNHAFGPGAFGENLLLDGVDEATVHIGDRWRVGGCVLRITEPRGPCGTLARRWAWPDLIGHVRRTARAGWYCAVDVEGPVAVGDGAELLERVAPEWPVARVFELLEARSAPAAALAALAASPGVHDGLRARCITRLETPGRTY